MIYTVPPQDIARIKQTEGLKVLQTPELRTIYLGFNQSRDELPSSDVKGKNPFRDARVREAVALAIDEPTIASRVMLGLGTSDLGDVGSGRQRLRRGAGCAAEGRSGQGKAAAGRRGLSERVPGRHWIARTTVT